MPTSTANFFGRVSNLVYTSDQWENTYGNIVLGLGELGIEAMVDSLADLETIVHNTYKAKINYGYLGADGKIYCYGYSDTDLYGYESWYGVFKIKIGDGVSTWNQLPYIDNGEVKAILDNQYKVEILEQKNKELNDEVENAKATINNLATLIRSLEARVEALEFEGETMYAYGPDKIRS